MEENYLTIKDIVSKLSQLGLNKGDAVIVHCAYSSLGHIEKGPEGVIIAIEEVIGPGGTLVMPVFNWDILHHGDEIIYDIKNTPSKMGYLTEYFRTREGTAITRHLFNPLAVTGRLAKELVSCPNHSCWGEDSAFQILYNNNSAIIMIGVDYNEVTMFHVAETIFGVPYRFTYEFPNAFLMDESGEKKPLKNTTQRRYNGYPTDFNVAEKIFEEKGLIRRMEIGGSITRLIRLKPMVDCIVNELKKDCEFLIKKTPSRKWVATRKTGNFYSMDFINQLWLKNRTLLGEDYDWALGEIGKILPIKISSYPTGMQVWDWTIPKKWTNRGGKICSLGGEVLFDLKDHPLYIAAGSMPFKGIVNKEDILKHIKTDPKRPDAIPYHTLYYDNDWAICLPHNTLSRLKDDFISVELDCEMTNGELRIGEYVIEGIKKDSIIIPLHLDHPGQCNDNLSGICVAIDIILKIQKMKKFINTIRFVFLPETIGIITYLSQNKEIITYLKWGIVFDSVGTSGNLMFMKSITGDTSLDICTKLAFKKLVPEHSEFSFLEIESYGNDERVLQTLGVEIPSISISRFPFSEYHSSLDVPDIISTQNLCETRNVVLEIIRTLDLDFIPIRKYEGIPQLSKMENLLRLFRSNPKTKKAIHKLFYLIDGKKSISEIALEVGMDFDFIYEFFMELKKHDKIEIKHI